MTPPFLDGFILTRIEFRVNMFFQKDLNDLAAARVLLTILIVPPAPIGVNYFFKKFESRFLPFNGRNDWFLESLTSAEPLLVNGLSGF